MASSARHLFLLALVAALAVAAPRGAGAWPGGRLFFSKTTRPEVAAGGATAAVPDAAAAAAAGPNGATTFSRPSTGGSGRGYGLYGRPEDDFPPAYFRRGVHHSADKLAATSVPATRADEAVPAGGRRERAEPFVEDNGSGRGRPPWTSTNVQTTTTTEETVPVGSSGNRAEPFVEDNGSGRGRPPYTYTYVPSRTATTEETVPLGGSGDRGEPFVEDNGSGRGRPPWYYGPDATGGRPEEQRDYGMSDTRLYQNGRYYYDVGTGRYGYGRESNPVRTRPEEFGGDSGFGRGGDSRFGRGAAGDYRRGRYGDAAGYYQNGNGDEFGNGVAENQNGFQEEGDNGRYMP